MRKRLYEIIEAADNSKKFDLGSTIYDAVMIVTITLSILPLAFKQEPPAFRVFDKVALVIFVIDYLLRLSTADFKYGQKTASAFLRYPFSPMAIVDLVSILPSLLVISSTFKLLRVVRMLRAFRVFRVFKAFRYSSTVRIIADVLHESREPLAAVFGLAVGYIILSAMVIFTVEADSFDNFFEAVYWATVSLTTVGYGDIYPVTLLGRIVTMLSSLTGIAIVALPSGIITAGYIKEINKRMEPKGAHVETLSSEALNTGKQKGTEL